MFQVDDLKTALVVAAACSWVTLVVLSLVPSRWQLGGDLRCATAFFIAAAVTRAAFREFETRWQLAGFMITAAVFWAYQMWTERRDVPARDGSPASGPPSSGPSSCVPSPIITFGDTSDFLTAPAAMAQNHTPVNRPPPLVSRLGMPQMERRRRTAPIDDGDAGRALHS